MSDLSLDRLYELYNRYEQMGNRPEMVRALGNQISQLEAQNAINSGKQFPTRQDYMEASETVLGGNTQPNQQDYQLAADRVLANDNSKINGSDYGLSGMPGGVDTSNNIMPNGGEGTISGSDYGLSNTPSDTDGISNADKWHYGLKAASDIAGLIEGNNPQPQRPVQIAEPFGINITRNGQPTGYGIRYVPGDNAFDNFMFNNGGLSQRIKELWNKGNNQRR